MNLNREITMKVEVLNRLSAERISGKLIAPHAIISIGDPPKKSGDSINSAVLADNPSRVGLLRMRFYDLDMSSVETAEEVGVILRDYGHGLFTKDQAKQIIDFVKEVEPKVQVIICHCEAGVSRSSAVAAAVLRILTGADDKIFNDRRYIPNIFVYRTILNVWGGKYNNG